MTRFKLSIAVLACSMSTSSFAQQADVRYRLTHIAGGSPLAQLQAGDLNDRGEVVGSATDFPNIHAFLWNGRFIDLSSRFDPASTSTFASGNNDRSDVAGAFIDAAGMSHGVLLLRGASAWRSKYSRAIPSRCPISTTGGR